MLRPLALLLGVLAFGSAAAGLADLRLAVRTDKNAYAAGEAITLTITLENRGGDAVTLEFPTAQRYDVVVSDGEAREVWRWSAGQMFAQGIGQETLGGGQSRTYRITTREKLPSGRYAVVARVPATNTKLSAKTEIRVE